MDTDEHGYKQLKQRAPIPSTGYQDVQDTEPDLIGFYPVILSKDLGSIRVDPCASMDEPSFKRREQCSSSD
jgi:hypothetical protein